MTAKTTKILAGLAVAGGAAWFAGGAVQISGAEIQPDKVESTAEHLNLTFFSLALVLTAAGVAALSRYAGNGTGALVAIAGMILLAGAGTASNIHGDDYSWFVVVAPLTNLMWFAGTIALAVSLKRRGEVPRWVYIGLPLVQIMALPFSSVGGGIVAGAYWITLGTMLAAGAVARRQAVAAA